MITKVKWRNHAVLGDLELDFTKPDDTPYNGNAIKVAAKSGTSQLGGNLTPNSVFMCYAPYENPGIAIAIVIERGASGAKAVSIAKDILDAYFSLSDSSSVAEDEYELLP